MKHRKGNFPKVRQQINAGAEILDEFHLYSHLYACSITSSDLCPTADPIFSHSVTMPKIRITVQPSHIPILKYE
jgi:hypothetical protein